MESFYFAKSGQVYTLSAEAAIVDKLLHSQLILDQLKAQNLYENGKITEKGKKALEPDILSNIVPNAIARYHNEPEDHSIIPTTEQAMLVAADEAHSFFEVTRSTAARKTLADFTISGELMLANAGHNGYSWKGEKINPHIPSKIDEINGGRKELPLEDLLLGSPIVGSSANLWVPVLTAQEIKKQISPKHSQMPKNLMKILMYHEGKITPAQFNVETATFQPFTSLADSFSPEEVELIDSPKVHSEYAKKFHATKLSSKPEIFRKIEYLHLRLTRMPIPNNVEFFTYKAMETAGAMLSRVTHHREYDSCMNASQFLVNYYSSDVSFRWNIARKFLHKEPSEEAIAEYCFATKNEVREVLQNTLARIPRNLQLRHFNRFLLYKAFERTVVDNSGHYIVGQITGDSQKIHMPYIKIDLRK
ncbi:hypothetical protein HZA96_03175 [Candidatus Woesearchaeota archaeon]|nr:hypothetical protein [Candidatus Woesearchaeota archaeon]